MRKNRIILNLMFLDGLRVYDSDVPKTVLRCVVCHGSLKPPVSQVNGTKEPTKLPISCRRRCYFNTKHKHKYAHVVNLLLNLTCKTHLQTLQFNYALEASMTIHV
jgi:hypothetical protein